MLTIAVILLVILGLIFTLRTRGLIYLVLIAATVVALVSIVWSGRRTL